MKTSFLQRLLGGPKKVSKRTIDEDIKFIKEHYNIPESEVPEQWRDYNLDLRPLKKLTIWDKLINLFIR